MASKSSLEKIQNGISASSKQIQDNLTETSREVWYAGLGILSTVEAEGARLFNKFVALGKDLVEKGKEFEKQDRQKAVSAKIEEAAKYVGDKLLTASEKVRVTGSSDLKVLNEKVDKLAESVAELTKKFDQNVHSKKT